MASLTPLPLSWPENKEHLLETAPDAVADWNRIGPSPSSTGKTVNLVSFQKCVSLEIMILFCVCAKSLSHVQLFVTS